MFLSVLSYCTAASYTSDSSFPKGLPLSNLNALCRDSFLCLHSTYSILLQASFLFTCWCSERLVSFSGLSNVFLGFWKSYQYSQDSKFLYLKIFSLLICISNCLYLCLGFPGKSSDRIYIKIFFFLLYLSTWHYHLFTLHIRNLKTLPFFYTQILT